MRRFADVLSIVVSITAAVVILAVSVTPFLSSAWVSFEQDRADAAGWTGFSAVDLRVASEAILSDLVMGPPSFDVTVRGEPVLTDAERGHMRDVRRVFSAFYLMAGAGLVVLILLRLAARRTGPWSRARYLSAIRGGAAGLSIGIVVAGVVATVAFDAAFEVFHRIFFAAGTYNFDPYKDRLVQLFPEAFWSETTIAVGVLTLVLAVVVVIDTSRRLRGEQSPRMADTAEFTR